MQHAKYFNMHELPILPFLKGMQHDVIRGAEPWGLPLNLKIMPEYFRDLGYKTHMIGKVRPTPKEKYYKNILFTFSSQDNPTTSTG